MKTFVLIHGAGDSGWYWHLLESELRRRGHDVVAPDLPSGDSSLDLDDYADAVVTAVGDRRELIVVAQSFGGFTAPLVAVRLPVEMLVFVAAMIPRPGEAPGEWWGNTGYREAVRKQSARDGGVTGNEDPYIGFYHDVPRDVATEALRHAQQHPSETCLAKPWPLAALPDVPTRFVLCTEDRFFPPDLLRRVVADRLGVPVDELAASHCVALSRPRELADLLESYARQQPLRPRLIDHYDAELCAHDERLRAAVSVSPKDRVLDIGCGSGKTTCDAARAATLGGVLGVDISEEMIERARRRGTTEGVSNVTFERGDAQVHPFARAHFDVIMSRFGTMFFSDPVAAFTHLARAARPDARLVMIVWQARDQNEWATAIERTLTEDGETVSTPDLDAFSLADPERIRVVLDASDFVDIALTEVQESVDYGSDTAVAFALVRDMKHVRDRLARMDAAAAERALDRLRQTLAAHTTSAGVSFDSRAWLVTARRSAHDPAQLISG